MISQKTEFSLEPSDCQRLLQEFPDLQASFETRVPLKSTEGEFWQVFLSKNFQYNTEIFLGNNPIFVPFKTDERNYTDKYIHNPQELLKSNTDKDQALKQKKALIDVNYLENTLSN
jgi:hypothetical protein